MRTQFIIDNNGNKLAVILPIKDYNKILEDMEELEDIRLYNEVVQSFRNKMTQNANKFKAFQ